MSRVATERGREDPSWYTVYNNRGDEVDNLDNLDALGGDAVVVDHPDVDIVLVD